jgi:hypothetical protein
MNKFDRNIYNLFKGFNVVNKNEKFYVLNVRVSRVVAMALISHSSDYIEL